MKREEMESDGTDETQDMNHYFHLVELYDRDRIKNLEMIWEGVRYFSTAITAVIGASIALLAIENIDPFMKVGGALTLLFISMILAIVGRLVMQRQSDFMLQDQWMVAKMVELLCNGRSNEILLPIIKVRYFEELTHESSGGFRNYMLYARKGIRFNFRILYLSFSILSAVLGFLIIHGFFALQNVAAYQTFLAVWGIISFLFIAVYIWIFCKEKMPIGHKTSPLCGK